MLGYLVKLLVHSGVTRYLEFKSVEASFVYKRGNKILKVPSSPQEAFTTSKLERLYNDIHSSLLGGTSLLPRQNMQSILYFNLALCLAPLDGLVVGTLCSLLSVGALRVTSVCPLTGLLGLFEKRRLKNFLEFVRDYDEGNPKTHQGT